ncbi:TetR/AcrR family transcriptional regulator [Prosthecomicrobium sp. N25]|uniref:TetR/AcrR family transcriptional regulator n=1 Tax=Prosthecomicrobium sp. N25 TaxID=3129254 RepID=UPI0030787E37
MASEKQRQKIVDGLLSLVSDREFDRIGFGEIADKAGLTLAQLRQAYDGKFAMLEDFTRRIDQEVIGEEDEGMEAEPVRDRLFDVLMRRFDALAPYKAAVAGLLRSARRDPLLAAALNTNAVTSMRWMLSAAGLDRGGLMGLARAQALALAWARVLQVWLEEEDPGLAKTMKALDAALKRLERIGRGAERLERALGPLGRCLPGGRRRRTPPPPPPAESSPDAAMAPA